MTLNDTRGNSLLLLVALPLVSWNQEHRKEDDEEEEKWSGVTDEAGERISKKAITCTSKEPPIKSRSTIYYYSRPITTQIALSIIPVFMTLFVHVPPKDPTDEFPRSLCLFFRRGGIATRRGST